MKKSTFFSLAAAMVVSAAAFTAQAEQTVKYTLSPAAGQATDLQSIEINFTEEEVFFYENSRIPVAVLTNNTTGAIYSCQEADRNTRGTAKTSYNLVFIGEDNEEVLPITQPGNYTLTVRGMYVNVEGEGPDADIVDMEDVASITAEYVINYPVQYLLTPAADSEVTNLMTVTVNFPDNTNVKFYENSRMPVAVLVNNTTGASFNCAEATRNTFAAAPGISYDLTFIPDGEEEAEEISAVGDYTLTIRGLALEIDDELEDLPVITAYYQIKYPVDYVLTPNPAEEVKDLSTVGLEFPANRNITFYENNRMPVATLVNLSTGAIYNCSEADRMDRAATEGIAYSFTFTGEDDEEALAITEPGEYQLTIRGLVFETEDGELGDDLPLLIANYTIAYPVEYVIYPLGNVATDLMNISIEFPEAKVDFYENNPMPVAVLENLTTGNIYNCSEADLDDRAMVTGCVYNFTFIGEDNDEALPITEPGEYLLTIRAMKQIVDIETEESVDLPVITKMYTINYPYTYVLEPAAGTEVKSISEVTLEFEDGHIFFYQNSTAPVVRLSKNGTEETWTCADPDREFRNQYGYSKFTFIFTNEDGEVATIDEMGDYTLTISGLYHQEDIIVDDEVVEGEQTDLPVIYAQYTVAFPVDYVLNPEDGETVENLQTITLEFPYTQNVVAYENSRTAVGMLENLTTEVIYECQTPKKDVSPDSEGLIFTFDFIEQDQEEVAPIAEMGEYLLTIRGLGITNESGEFIGDVPVITATYYIVSSGVEAEELLGDDTYTVYSISGVKVADKAASLEGLGSGLYIVNGKKVLIRK